MPHDAVDVGREDVPKAGKRSSGLSLTGRSERETVVIRGHPIAMSSRACHRPIGAVVHDESGARLGMVTAPVPGTEPSSCTTRSAGPSKADQFVLRVSWGGATLRRSVDTKVFLPTPQFLHKTTV